MFFLQLPIRPNSIFPLSVVYGIMGWGLCIYLCMHVCMHRLNVCISLCMYVLCMHNTYICVYVCMYTYTNTNQIYYRRNVTPKCESEARNHTYMMHVCTQ